MKYRFATRGTCSRSIEFTIKDGLIDDVFFEGGCHGNLQGICALVRGMSPQEVISRLEGIRCGNKSTSCPDQLACALRSVAAH